MKLMGCLLMVCIAATTLMAEDQLSLTIYNSGFGIVRESKDVVVPAGISTIEHKAVSELILDEPIRFAMSGAELLDQRFRHDLLSLDYMLDQHYQKQIVLELLSNKGNGRVVLEQVEGVLLSRLNVKQHSADFRVLLQLADGSIRTINPNEIDNYIFPSLPEATYEDPTMLWTVSSEDSGSKRMDISYELLGLDWGAFYILDLSANDSTATFSGWVEIENNGDRPLEDVELKLVDSKQGSRKNMKLRAGSAQLSVASAGGDAANVIARQSGYKTRGGRSNNFSGSTMNEIIVEYEAPAVELDVTSKMSKLSSSELEMSTGGGAISTLAAKSASVEALLGNQLYSLPHEVTIPERSYSEIALFPSAKIMLKTEYEFRGWQRQQNVGVYVKLKNSEEFGLGKPLPAGGFMIYRVSESGTPESIGDTRLNHLGVDDSLRIRVGDASGIKVTRERYEHIQHSDTKFDDAWRITFRNERDSAVDVMLHDHFPLKEYKILESTHELIPVGDHLVKLPLTLPPQGEVVVSYKVRQSSK